MRDAFPETRGWVPLPRLPEDHPIFRRPIAVALYALLLGRARYRAGPARCGNGEVYLEVGQAVYGEHEMAKLLGVNRQPIRTNQRYLVNYGLITLNPTKQGHIATICNYGVSGKEDMLNQPTPNQRPTNGVATIKEGNKANKENKEVRSNASVLRTLDKLNISESLRDQFKNEAINIADAWSALEGVRRADPLYVVEGLRRGVHNAENLPVEYAQDYLIGLAREVEDAIDAIGRSAEKPRYNESLWNWHCRNTGEWLGSETETTY